MTDTTTNRHRPRDLTWLRQREASVGTTAVVFERKMLPLDGSSQQASHIIKYPGYLLCESQSVQMSYDSTRFVSVSARCAESSRVLASFKHHADLCPEKVQRSFPGNTESLVNLAALQHKFADANRSVMQLTRCI